MPKFILQWCHQGPELVFTTPSSAFQQFFQLTVIPPNFTRINLYGVPLGNHCTKRNSGFAVPQELHFNVPLLSLFPWLQNPDLTSQLSDFLMMQNGEYPYIQNSTARHSQRLEEVANFAFRNNKVRFTVLHCQLSPNQNRNRYF